MCSHCLMCNFLTTILKPNFEPFVDTAQQLVDKNMTIYFFPRSGKSWIESFKKAKDPNLQKLGESAIIPQSWGEFDNFNFKGSLLNNFWLQKPPNSNKS